MILSVNLSKPSFKPNTLVLFRHLLYPLTKSIKKFLQSTLIYHQFPYHCTESNTIINIINHKYLTHNYSNHYTNNKPSITLVLLINILQPSPIGIKQLQKKITLLKIPHLPQNCTITLSGINKTIISQLRKTLPFQVKKLSTGELIIKVTPLTGPILTFTLSKSKSIYLKLGPTTKVDIFSALSIFGVTITSLFNFFIPESKLIILSNTILIQCDLSGHIGLFTTSNVYSSIGKLLLPKGLYINYHFILNNPYTFYLLHPDYHNNLILSKTTLVSTHSFKKNSRLNLPKIYHLFPYNILILPVFNILPNTDYMNINNKRFLDQLSNKTVIIPSETYQKVIQSFKSSYNPTPTITNLYPYTLGNLSLFTISQITRSKINKLLSISSTSLTLTKLDILSIINYLNNTPVTNIKYTPIDSLEHKSLLCIGDQLTSIIKYNLPKYINHITKSIVTNNTIPSIIKSFSSKILTNYIREFFYTSPLSQFLDQTNHLSELTHKRRVTHIYHSNLSKKSISPSLRNVNMSHFGRLCPIETPEGENIGLLNSLSSFTSTNHLNILTTPLITSVSTTSFTVAYLTLSQERIYPICNSPYSYLTSNPITKLHRFNNSFWFTNSKINKFTCVSPIQLFAIAPLMIPYLEHNDGNRVLMGSNMQRQAIPCIKLSLPYVSTSIEHLPAITLNHCSLTNKNFINLYHDSNIIIFYTIIKKYFSIKTYHLKKFIGTNQHTYFNQRPNLNYKFPSTYHQLSNDTSNTINGFLCLGQNLLSAFLPWRGYNFEDAIIISNRIAHSDNFTSIHIYCYSTTLNSTPYGDDIINKSLYESPIPNLISIGHNGIITVGSTIKPNDTLVCKLTHKQRNTTSPLNNFLDNLLHHNPSNYIDSPLKVPLGIYGKVTSTILLSKHSTIMSIGNHYNFITIPLYSIIIKSIIIRKYRKTLQSIPIKKTITIKDRKLSLNIPKNLCNLTPLYYTILINNKLSLSSLPTTIINHYPKPISGSIKKRITITITSNRKLQVGDKMSGRHGNKGVISKILPIEDMPYLPDGTPCDIILNPISIPSRMNISQLFELKLGLLVYFLFKRIKKFLYYSPSSLFPFLSKIGLSIPPKHQQTFIKDYTNVLTFTTTPFEGSTYSTLSRLSSLIITNSIKKKYCVSPSLEKVKLYDGLTNKSYQSKISIGYLYFYKLIHLSLDKLHARSTGPYSSITQQPLKGKTNLGGQRLGEMEVWALEAYGAAYVLQEMLTIKSDDIQGRDYLYQSIIQGNITFKYSIPESFKTLVMELRALSFNITLSWLT